MSVPAIKMLQQKTRQIPFRSVFVIIVALSVFAGLSPLYLSACTTKDNLTQTDENERVRIIATVFAPYDFSRQIAGPYADVRMLVPPGMEIHAWEPTPQDIVDIAGCDLFIYVGGESDSRITALLESLDTSHMQILRLVDCVELLDEDNSVLVDFGLWDFGNSEPDEHVWTSVKNAKLISREITERLKSIDPANREFYDEAVRAYLAELDALDATLCSVVGQARHTTLVFGDRFPFLYLAHDLGLTCYAAFPGCSTASEPSAQTVARLIDVVRAEQIQVIFFIELSDRRLADAVARETGAQVLPLNSCHNSSVWDFENGETYISLMRANAENLKAALY